MSARDLNRRHLRALGLLARYSTSPFGLPLEQLRAAVGPNATNTIASLEARGLILCGTQYGGNYFLTKTGLELVDELRQELASA